jgi:hypothetical protein
MVVDAANGKATKVPQAAVPLTTTPKGINLDIPESSEQGAKN